MKRIIKPNKARAKSLHKMAIISLERLNSIDKKKYPSNTINDYYDITHQLMESFSTIKGIKFSGDFAHKELIDWVSKEIKLKDSEKIFLQTMRGYRNRISYEGFFIKPNFVTQNEERIIGIVNNLTKELEKLL